MNILQAIRDENLFRPFLSDGNGELTTWGNWLTALRTLHGMPVIDKGGRQLIRDCTGRDALKLPNDGFQNALFLVGRRSGKSRIAALTAAYEAALSGREKLLSPGEIGLVAVVSPTRFQSRIVKSYIRAAFDSTPILQGEIEDETKNGFQLRNGVEVQILAGDFRSVRGFSLLSAIVDEICFFHLAEDGKIRSDSELIQALRPGLSTVQGRLLCIGSPYAERGWAYKTWKRCFGNEKAKTLVWRAASRVMNPTLSQSIVDEALAEDLAAGKSEYLAEWRADIAVFIPREVVEELVVVGRKELLPMPNRRYSAFVDISGGRSDDAALCIAHRSSDRVVVDQLLRWKAPFNPHTVVAEMAEQIRRFGLYRATGDFYAAEFTARAFESHGIRYRKCDKSKSQLYVELLPILCSSKIELLDDDLLVSQLASLERRTRSGGRDSIDHPAGKKDDLANAVAGVAVIATKPRNVAGAIVFGDSDEPTYRSMAARQSWLRGIHPGNGAKLS